MLIRRYQHSHLLCLLLLVSYNQAVVDISDCVNDNNIEDFPNETSNCCPQDADGLPEWLVQTKLGQYSCVFNHCHGNSSVFYDGKCRDLLEDGACGDDLGMRLYLGEDGAAYCDCMEGWLTIDGKCYQELTFAPDLCKNENEIIRFNKHRRIFFEEPTPEEIHQSKNRYVCEKNICNSTDFLPHLSTWEHKKCHKVPEGNLECELYVGFHADNDSPPLYCCYPENRSSCDVETLLDTNSVFLTKTADCKAKCRWSEIKKKCIRKSRNSRVKC